MKVLYGDGATMIDVTPLAIKWGILDIPETDRARADIYGDPVSGVLKYILITDDYNNTRRLDHTESIICKADSSNRFDIKHLIVRPDERLKQLHASLKLSHGSFNDEYPEQVMAALYIEPTDTVLEIGANIGRNTLIIASLLDDSHRLVTVESDPESVRKLTENRNQNQLQFQIIPAAISKRPLIQQGWTSRPAEQAVAGAYSVNTVTYDEVCKQTGLQFNVLVADCEGALYYILQDEPTFLDGITKVIMENDYTDIKHKQYVDSRLRNAGLRVVYTRPLNGSSMVCAHNFFEVWEKM